MSLLARAGCVEVEGKTVMVDACGAPVRCRRVVEGRGSVGGKERKDKEGGWKPIPPYQPQRHQQQQKKQRGSGSRGNERTAAATN